jgi:hypothetical protein
MPVRLGQNDIDPAAGGIPIKRRRAAAPLFIQLIDVLARCIQQLGFR